MYNQKIAQRLSIPLVFLMFLTTCAGLNTGPPSSAVMATPPPVEPWSIDGSKIAYNYGSPEQIYMMNRDGMEPTNLTNNTADNYDPARLYWGAELHR